nr:hypothetical protein [Actinomycetota bacterium]
MKLWVIAAVFGSLLVASAAEAGTYAKVISPSGRVLFTGASAQFRYPADGSIVQIGSASSSLNGASLNDIQVLGGIAQISSIDTFANGRIALGSIAAAGHLIPPTPNTLVPLGPAGYMIVNQQAVSNRHVGHMALRLVLRQAVEAVPAGTEILIGTPFA